MSLEVWQDALTAAGLLAVDPPAVGGVALRARAGPVRDYFCRRVRDLLPPEAPFRRIPAHVTEDRLLGGLDLAATLRAGRVVAERGLLADLDGGGIAVVPMAERLEAVTTAHLAGALDRGEILLERDGLGRRNLARLGVIALDEGIDDERLPVVLGERLAIHLDLDAISPRWLEESSAEGVLAPPYDRQAVALARTLRPSVVAPDDVVKALCSVGVTLGIDSVRAPILALAVARSAAALAGRDRIETDDVSLAARLVLAPRATRMPEPMPEEEEASPPEPEPPEEPPPPEEDSDDSSPAGPLEDLVLEAVRAALPQGLLERLHAEKAARGGPATSGPAGALRASMVRGRPAGVRRGTPESGAKLNVVETLRAAAPWQRLRRSAQGKTRRVEVRQDDFRVTRYKRRTETLTIFAVDASGSSALQRLAEAKGAVEQVLADCYARRDNVALIGFRCTEATLLLPPTKSLVRAKRCLAELPGGGATPLATGLDAARALAEDARRRGQTPVVVVMTDGRANVARDGQQGRPAAEADALASARALRDEGIRTLFVDTAPRPRPASQKMAQAMDAYYLALPYTDAEGLARVVRGRARGATNAPPRD